MITMNVWPRLGTTVTLISGAVITSAGASVTSTSEIIGLLELGNLLSWDPTAANPNPSPLPSTSTNGVTLATVAAMQALSTSQAGQLCVVRGYSADNDGGGGMFRLDPVSSATVNGGTILAASPAGRWLRVYDKGEMCVDWFGPGDGTKIQTAIDLCQADGGGTVRLGPRAYDYGSAFSISGPVSLLGCGRSTVLRLAPTTPGGNSHFGIASILGAPATFTGSVAEGTRTFTVSSSAGFVAGDDVFCIFGDDPYDSAEQYCKYFDVVQSVPDSTHIVLRSGCPEAVPSVGTRTNKIYKPTSIVQDIEFGDLSVTLAAGAIIQDGMGSIQFVRNVRIHDIYIENTNGGMAIANSTNVVVENIYSRIADGAPHGAAGRILATDGSRNVVWRNISSLDTDRIAFFVETQTRGLLIENVNVRSGFDGVATDPVFFLAGGSKGIVIRNVRLRAEVPRIVVASAQEAEYRTEDFTVDGTMQYWDLGNHTGALRYNGYSYGSRRSWSKTYRLPYNAQLLDYDLPKGQYAVVKGFTNNGTAPGGCSILCQNNFSNGFTFGEPFAAPGTLVQKANIGLGSSYTISLDDNKLLTIITDTTSPVNAFFTLEIEYFPYASDDTTDGKIQDALHSRQTSMELGTAIITTGAAAPTVGAWRVGDVVYSTTPTSGGNIGWVCTTAGSPGTWKTFGAIA